VLLADGHKVYILLSNSLLLLKVAKWMQTDTYYWFLPFGK
jgi:hypothetical protein